MPKFCTECGKNLKDSDIFCDECGTKQEDTINEEGTIFIEENDRPNHVKLGFSDVISSPEFDAELNTRKVNLKHTFIFCIIIVIGFAIGGFIFKDLGQPMGTIVGLGIATITFVLSIYSKNKQAKDMKAPPLDGVVSDKYIERDREEYYDERGNKKYKEWYLIYVVEFKMQNGKTKKLKKNGNFEDSGIKFGDHFYNYYNMGDVVRYHAKLDFYEKYDKTKDDYIFCAMCKTKNSINDSRCKNCHLPLLK